MEEYKEKSKKDVEMLDALLPWEYDQLVAYVEDIIDNIRDLLSCKQPQPLESSSPIPPKLLSAAETKDHQHLFEALDEHLCSGLTNDYLDKNAHFQYWCTLLFGSQHNYLRRGNHIRQAKLLKSMPGAASLPLPEEALVIVCKLKRWHFVPKVGGNGRDEESQKEWARNLLLSLEMSRVGSGKTSVLGKVQDDHLKDTDATKPVYEEHALIHSTREPPPGSKDWLRLWLQYKGLAKPQDLAPHTYEGARTEAPCIQLIRAKNFLADENIDRTTDFEAKLNLLTRYCQHLRKIHRGEEWGKDLDEVCDMISTHRAYNKLRDGRPKLQIEFTPLPTESVRLPSRAGLRITLLEGMRPRITPLGPLSPPAQIYFRLPVLHNVPRQESIDPHSYMVMNKSLIDQQTSWAQWARERTIQRCWDQKQTIGRIDPPVPLPKNFNGPVVADPMDMEMKKTWDLLRKYQKLEQELRRMQRAESRPWMDDIVECMEEGLQGGEYPRGDKDYLFRADEIVPPLEDVRPVRAKEVEWLEYLTTFGWQCNPQGLTVENMARHYSDSDLVGDRLGDPTSSVCLAERRIYAKRVFDMLKSRDPSRSGFGDDEIRDYKDWLQTFNEGCRGPVQRVKFSMASVEEAYEMKYAFSAADVERVGGQYKISRLKPLYYPEETIRWCRVPSRRGRRAKSKKLIQEPAVEESTVSTEVSIPESAADEEIPVDYVQNLPRKEDLRSWREMDVLKIENADTYKQDEKELSKTTVFYRCLAFRLGLTIRNLNSRYADDLERLRNPERRKQNLDFLIGTIETWSNDTNNPSENPSNSKHGKRATKTLYKDIVQKLEPSGLARHDDNDENTTWAEKERVCADIVRKHIIRELYENKNLLWSAAESRGYPPEKGDTTRPSRRREALWTFGHPANKPKVRRFFDVNRWPLHLQDESRQVAIYQSGPTPVIGEEEAEMEAETAQTGKKQQQQGSVEKKKAEEEERKKAMLLKRQADDEIYKADIIEETKAEVGRYEILSYRKNLKARWVLWESEFDKGDTDLQRKAILDKIRKQLEYPRSPSKKKTTTWGSKITSMFGGRKRKRDDDDDGEKEKEEDPLALPTPAFIVKSRPAKQANKKKPDDDEDGGVD